MGAKSPQSHAKRARELAVRERRDRKREKKLEAAAQRAAEAAAAAEPRARAVPSPPAEDEA